MATEKAGDYGALRQQYVHRFIEQNPKSEAAISDASGTLPSGTSRAVLVQMPFPLVFGGGHDACVTSVDGITYLDFVSEYTAAMCGHSHPDIVKTIHEVADAGFVLGGANQKEAELSGLLVSRFPSMDAIRFCNSGTEANIMAIATGLYYTSRQKVLVFTNAYHGGTLSFYRHNPVNLPHQFVYGTYNDIERTRDCIDIDVGVILVEPVQGAGAATCGTREFLQFLRDEATRIGAVLIFDEVVTSRLWYGGIQEYIGVTPDMTTLGKHFGGGFSFGGFGGKRAIMDLFVPGTSRGIFHSGTWNNNVFSMSAGVVAAKLLSRDAIERTNYLGDKLRSGLQAILDSRNITFVRSSGFGSVVGMLYSGPSAQDLRELFYFYCLDQHIYMGSRGFFALNITHKEEHVENVLEVAKKFFDKLL